MVDYISLHCKEFSARPHQTFTTLEPCWDFRCYYWCDLIGFAFNPELSRVEPNVRVFFFFLQRISPSSHQAVKRSMWWHVWRVDANLFWSGIFSWRAPPPSCHFGPESEHIAQGSLIYTLANTCWCLLTALQNVDRRPACLTGWGGVGSGGVGEGPRSSDSHRMIWWILSWLINCRQQQGFSFPWTFWGDKKKRRRRKGRSAAPTSPNTCEAKRAHMCAHFEGHRTWAEWLRGGQHLVSSYWNPSLYTSAMKHLPIKSNDACDSKGIKVKWCVQWLNGHLQMAAVQERDLQSAMLGIELRTKLTLFIGANRTGRILSYKIL